MTEKVPNNSSEYSLPHISGQSNKPLSQPPHALPYTDVLTELSSDPVNGLTASDAAQRLQEFGHNELNPSKGVQPVKIFLEQVFNSMTIVLLMALAASFGIKAWIEGGILGGIIVLNIFIGFAQTLQAEKTINSLKSLGSPTATITRDGKTFTVQTREIVPGDIVELNTGDSVPADIRLIEARNLKTDEAMLTGESVPVLKNPNNTFKPHEGPGDRLNVVYSSTTVTEGRGRGVVFATAMCTEIGLIAGALNNTPHKKGPWYMVVASWVTDFLGLTVGTPLQRKLSQLFLALFGFAIICAVIVMGANKFDSRSDIIIYAVTTAVGTIPVSLLLVLTVTMAAGTKKMLHRNVMVRNLSSLEALGGVTNICSDKTGTITQGRMVVRKAWLPGVGTYSVDVDGDVYNPHAGKVSHSPVQPRHQESGTLRTVEPEAEIGSQPALEWYLNIASLDNLASLEQNEAGSSEPGKWVARGAPTEIAIEVFAGRFGWNRLQLTQGNNKTWDVVAEFPFDSDVKKMSVIGTNHGTGETHAFCKGAVERVIDSCHLFANEQNATQPLTDDDRNKIHDNMEALAKQGLRVLALASKPYTGDTSDVELIARQSVESDLIFRGLIGIYDPPRPESRASVLQCQGAGISVHMLTGDHPQTARAIATDVCILPSPEKFAMLPADVASTMVLPAHDFDALSDAQLDDLPQLPLVVARCSPNTKVRMISALHRRGRYVAMTGDGVNDSPSLKRADIGIAMGTGSDVAKESSDIVLTDDNFASILNAIEEGRRIFDNIQKFILHVLAANIGFVVALLTGLAFKDDAGVSIYQLSPVEIIWILMGTGAFCETGLGFEKAVPDILTRPPQNLKYGVFTPEFIIDMLAYGFIQAICIITSFVVVIWGFNNGNLGQDCNLDYSDSCEAVFRARATCYTVTSWVFVFFAWELIDFRRSFFYMPDGFRKWIGHLWSNKFLFFSVTMVFITTFPTLYIPVLDKDVFMHLGIKWEWAVVVIAVGFFIVATEGWKWAKRIYFRRKAAANAPEENDVLGRPFHDNSETQV